MLKRLVLIMFTVALCVSGLFADQADLVFAALKAKNDKEVTRILQDLALARDYAQLDKVQEKNPELFDVQYFPGEFVSKIIFNYVEDAAANTKAAQKATGTTNPHTKNSWQWFIWDLDKALTAREVTKDAALKKTLSDQISKDIKGLQSALGGSLDMEVQFTIGMYLFAANLDVTTGGSVSVDAKAEVAEELNSQFASESNVLLEYLFNAGVPFSAVLPGALKLDAWKRLKSAYDSFTKITVPEKQSEYETTAEFQTRNAEARRLDVLVRSVELSLQVKLALGEYNVEGGYFSLGISLPALTPEDQGGKKQAPLAIIRDLGMADIRYYINRKNAPFFKDKGFASWTATATIAAREPGIYGLKELAVKNGKDPQTEGLWGFRVWIAGGNTGESLVKIENYIQGREYDFSGTKVSGYAMTIPILADGSYILSSSTDGPGQFWVSKITAVWVPVIGDIGPAGGIVFYDKGSYSDGWRFLEAAPSDQSTGIKWENGTFKTIKTGTAIGTGRENTVAIMIAQDVGSYAAALCDSLIVGDYDDWFLPSKDELNLMYTNLKKAGLGGFERSWFWSSSQSDGRLDPWIQSFSDGEQLQYYNYGVKLSVRACRAFSLTKDIPVTVSTPAVKEPAQVIVKEPVQAIVKEPVQPVVKETSQTVPKGFVLVSEGTFLMGSPNSEKGREKHEGPQHQVSLSAFLIGKYEVTVAEFADFIRASSYRTTAEVEGSGVDMKNPASLTSKASWQNPFISQTKTDPVVMVTWIDAVNYCNWRSKQEGLSPVYDTGGSSIVMNQEANGYRLPTEAEWEYAARGGPQWALQPFVYAGSANLEDVGWYGKNSKGGSKPMGGTNPVGQKTPNVLGIFDMSGNVSEWCWDFYSKDYYAKSSAKDPLGPSSGTGRVYRGGHWYWDTPNFQRVACRAYDAKPPLRSNAIGFRLVRKP